MGKKLPRNLSVNRLRNQGISGTAISNNACALQWDSSTGSNLGPSNPDLKTAVQKRIAFCALPIP